MSAKPDAESKYKDTLFLPDTEFPMRGGLPEAEPVWLKKWAEMDLYRRMREDAKGRPLFVFHDGPPYANGNIHIGHALNKILKDFVVRSQQMMGKDAPNIPGWDCHGLPIEWKVEEEYRAKGIDKDSLPQGEFRARCRDYAKYWIGEQKREFIRLGCIGDWDNEYQTMSFGAEAQIVREILKFRDNGLLYRGSKPVMWSIVEKTALAEAEVEYQDKKSPQIWVRFPVVKGPKFLAGSDVVIWTTTPWTIPANRAIAYGPNLKYALIEVSLESDDRVLPVTEGQLSNEEKSKATASGQSLAQFAKELTRHIESVRRDVFLRGHAKLLVVDDLLRYQELWRALHVTGHTEHRKDIAAKELEGVVCAHPFRGQGYDFDVPLLPGEHVTDDTGTGFVHTAPGHGVDDFKLGVEHKLEIPFTVDADGSFYPHVPLFAGKKILTPEGKDGDANGAVIRELMNAGKLLAKGSVTHSYPHSWRSKAPLIFRNTPQWFLAMDTDFAAPGGAGTLRERALAEIKKTKWVPPQGENRLSAMVKDKPDWVLSRQRAWGVPIAIFVRKADGQTLADAEVDKRIADTIEREGADAWFARPASDFLGNTYNPEDYEKVTDILDVWFESGATHAYVLKNRMKFDDQADLYLEGSDQHRGWFQSSLIESVGTRGRAPFKAVLTHGFTLDEQGRKMSKSLGNTIEPQKAIDQYGADILRLWVASTEFTEDQRVGPEILKANAEAYRKLRNTVRYILSNLKNWDERERLSPKQMPELERWVLHRLSELDEGVRNGYAEFDFNRVFAAITHFCISDLSAFYFDIRKDALYCDKPSSIRRRAARTVLDHLFATLTAWLAPILCFTMEEAWAARMGVGASSVHLRQFPELPRTWRDGELAYRWARVRDLRRVLTGALELARKEKRIGSSLEAGPALYLTDPEDRALFSGLDLAELAITSSSKIEASEGPTDAFRLSDVQGVAVMFEDAKGEKCERCWRVLPDVGSAKEHRTLCGRCVDAVEGHGAV